MAAIERGEQRGALARGTLEPDGLGAFLGPAIDMQPVLDREILEVAEPGIDAHQRLVRRVGLADAGFRRQPGFPRGLHDQLAEPVAAAPVEPVGLGIFVDQAFQPLLVVGKPRTRSAAAADGRW
jgi:hypothetical protein